MDANAVCCQWCSLVISNNTQTLFFFRIKMKSNMIYAWLLCTLSLSASLSLFPSWLSLLSADQTKCDSWWLMMNVCRFDLRRLLYPPTGWRGLHAEKPKHMNSMRTTTAPPPPITHSLNWTWRWKYSQQASKKERTKKEWKQNAFACTQRCANREKKTTNEKFHPYVNSSSCCRFSVTPMAEKIGPETITEIMNFNKHLNVNENSSHIAEITAIQSNRRRRVSIFLLSPYHRYERNKPFCKWSMQFQPISEISLLNATHSPAAAVCEIFDFSVCVCQNRKRKTLTRYSRNSWMNERTANGKKHQNRHSTI